jgi:Na+/H+ antiporter NhaD/arsenite permease-like protein
MSGLSRFVSGYRSGARKHQELKNELDPEPQVSGRTAFIAVSAVVLALAAFACWLEFVPHTSGSSSTSGEFLMLLAILFVGVPALVATVYRNFVRRRRQRTNSLSRKNS